MNNCEKRLLSEIYELLIAIPLPIVGGGTQSASLQGFIDFGHEMGKVKEKIQTALRYLRDNELNDCQEEINKLKVIISMFER